MACSCKSKSSNRQVSSVKQIVKKPSRPLSTSRPVKKITTTKRVIFKKHI